MIGRILDKAAAVLSPSWGVSRQRNRQILRGYAGAEANRLNAQARPRNQAADAEMLGPFGADAVRAWSRKLVRDNAYAWGVVDTIVSSVVGCGITAQSMLEDEGGEDLEDVNWLRDDLWNSWCEVCDVNGQYSFSEMQRMVQREITEAGEVLVHIVRTPGKTYRGITRPVPIALELIEADRMASDQDTYALSRDGGKRIVRGVEMDDLGKPLAYWIYPQHPSAPSGWNRSPERIPAKDIRHLYRRDRIGQSRGVSWFAPVVSWLRDLGVYVDNELQASTVAACFSVAIKTDGPFGGLNGPQRASDTHDSNGNQWEYLEPGIVTRLGTNESIEVVNPSRPNSSAEPWIALMLRGISVGTGLSYEVVSRDYSKTTYSSSRTSQLEDRRRFRSWQKYLVNDLCQPIWDEFCTAAALVGHEAFPTMTELLDDRRNAAPVEWQTPEWEWVDPQNEQQASQNSIDALQSDYQTELGARGRNWKKVFYQRAKEEKLKRELGLSTLEQSKVDAKAAGSSESATGEMAGLSRLQFTRNRKAIEDILNDFASGAITEAKARAFLGSIGMAEASIDLLIQDASDGSVDDLPEDQPQESKELVSA